MCYDMYMIVLSFCLPQQADPESSILVNQLRSEVRMLFFMSFFAVVDIPVVQLSTGFPATGKEP